MFCLVPNNHTCAAQRSTAQHDSNDKHTDMLIRRSGGERVGWGGNLQVNALNGQTLAAALMAMGDPALAVRAERLLANLTASQMAPV